MSVEFGGLVSLLQVYDMPASLQFYCELLGFSIVESSERVESGSFHWVWLRRGSAELMLNTAYEFDHERPAVEDTSRVQGHSDVALFIGCPDIDGAYRELKEKGMQVSEPRVAPYGMKQMNVSDPDGYGICFQWPAE